jgi:hypothetical protein
VTESKLKQIIKEEFYRVISESEKKEAPEHVSYEVEVPHRKGDRRTEVADAVQKAQMKAVDDHEARYDISDDHGKGYKVLGRTESGKVRYKVYLSIIKR